MNYPTLTLSTLLSSWDFDIQEKSTSPVRVVRHAGQGGTPKALYNTGLEIFEKYQAYQSKKIFGNAEYLVVFLGLEKDISSFIGIYRVVGLSEISEQGYEPPSGPKELIEICDGSRYFYHLQREQKFDLLREKFTIRWNSQANRWCQQLQKEDKVIESFFDEQGGFLNPNLLFEWQEEKNSTEQHKALFLEETSYSEGEQYYKLHLVRERSPALVEEAKRIFKEKNNNHLFCEACGFDFSEHYGVLGEGYIECHHTIPVHTLLPDTKTKITDICLLCANCHRVVHRSKKWLSLEELKSSYKK